MNKREIFLGNSLVNKKDIVAQGEFIMISDEKFYKISNYDQIPDFFMTIVSDSDHWMFVSSKGSLSAGRKDRDNALFPYYSVDKIHDYNGITGSQTICLVEKNNRTCIWEPFSKELAALYRTERNLYKSLYGNQIIFEEINHDLGVSFQYQWSNSEKFGFVKQSSIRNITREPIKVELLDGIGNILPSGLNYIFQNEYSNLADAYKKAELDLESGLSLFMLSSIPVDKAEPSESLKATTVWTRGLTQSKILISSNQINDFKEGLQLSQETDIRALRGAFFVNTELILKNSEPVKWITVADINKDSADVANLRLFLKNADSPIDQVVQDVQKGTDNLVKIIAGSDGLQYSNEELSSARHFSNTLFNIMRGGTFLTNYIIDIKDFKQFVFNTNRKFYKLNEKALNRLSKTKSVQNLLKTKDLHADSDFVRICFEYIPLTFSRRHGDPSRPWNQFSIDNKNADGSHKLDFQGNWRDIFQNWEALSLAFPGYICSFITKFLNASTADGYNPYRITRNGINWECPDPDDPWAYIGYWGDHQVIYLQKLLELHESYDPGALDEWLEKEIFGFANVPYRIKPYKDLVNNPKDTIVFDHELNSAINNKVKEIGSDGRLILNMDNTIRYVNLTEKILVLLLSKLSNFVPEAGIWLNTQRPEWNDANNALVGNGASMVTLYYLRRFVKFWNSRFSSCQIDSIHISAELKVLFDKVLKLFDENTGILANGFSNKERRQFVDVLGKAGEDYRNSVYSNLIGETKKKIQTAELTRFTQLTLNYIDQSIRVNKRTDGLYHAYNLVKFESGEITIRHLYEMLEGQVAVISSGYLSASENLSVLDALKKSDLYRKNQNSYLLYPDRELPRFNEKNNIPAQKVNESRLLSKLVKNNNKEIICVDNNVGYHFNGSIRNGEVLSNALNELDQKKYGSLVFKEKSKILEVYEKMFDHQSFTGRSGTFYGYEGLGSIYWHMVSKLLLATVESYFAAVDDSADQETIERIEFHFNEIKDGIGLHKSPEVYGAFPTDPYSHTPGNSGAKQPGMTGQVKEDILTRFFELGVKVKKGIIHFNEGLVKNNEFTSSDARFKYYDVNNKRQQIKLRKGQLAFTFCQVPVIYSLGEENSIDVFYKDRKIDNIKGSKVKRAISRLIFNRSNKVLKIVVTINR